MINMRTKSDASNTFVAISFSIGTAKGDDGREAIVCSIIGEGQSHPLLLILPKNVVMDFQEQIWEQFANLGNK